MWYSKIPFLVIVSFVVNVGCTPKEDRPNIIIIFTDDQGYADLGCFGGDHVYTPHIDQMAQEGARLTSFYVAAPLCTPSRAALMTGCYPRRVSMEPPSSIVVNHPNIPDGKSFPVLLAGDGHGLHPDEITIAELAQSAGYKTGMFGKWHLGDQPHFLPTRQGFDEFFGLPYSHDIGPNHPNKRYDFPPLPLLEGEEVIELDPDARFLTKRITERSIRFIEENKDDPFFLYIPHPIPHRPIHVAPPFLEGVSDSLKDLLARENGYYNYRNSDQLYTQAINELDWSTGQILEALKRNRIDENTLVIFTSDNGPQLGKAKPLSGKKGSTLEGGMRMPTVIRWPKGIKAGGASDELMTAMDLLPTFAHLMGAEVPQDRIIDGKDILPVLTAGEPSPHEYFFYSHWGTLEAVRWKDWKLRVVKGEEALYNLKTDISEKQNLVDQYPDIVAQLKLAMQNFDQEITANARPVGVVENPEPLNLE